MNLFSSKSTLLCLGLLALCVRSVGYAQTVESLPLHRISYAATFKSIPIGSVTLQLSFDGTHYHYQTLANPVWLARVVVSQSTRESSEFALATDGVRALDYSLSDPEKPKQGTQYHYDWDHQIVKGNHDNEPFSLPLATPTYDPLSIRAQLLFDFARGKSAMRYSMLDGREVKTFVYQKASTETVHTSLGDIKTVRWDSSREHASPSDRQWRYWLAPDFGFLPVEIEQVQDGKSRLKFTVTALEWTDPKTQKSQVLGNVTPR